MNIGINLPERTTGKRWPHPKYDIDREPHFLFILTPPNSGSTALAKILNSAQGTAFLRKWGEGQWLVPGMCEADRWDPEKPIDWDSVRAVWLKQVELLSELVGDIALIIEKSPPNIVRMDGLRGIFPRGTMTAFNRDPYANCSSILHRYHDPKSKSADERMVLVSKFADEWLFRSGWIKKWIERWELTHFSYEGFCASPSDCVSKLAVELPVLRTVDVGKKIRVKDYKMQKIADFNEEQISNLTRGEVETISKKLGGDPEIVSFFGYDIL